ncbi:hypothetical protein Pcinc_038525 [Petrolisthes cinctipes]|uniref:Uncharacterized protein n=1 Tax=Petrolisthes cinctipes TaxID=88211 RepID=A0AAE1ELI0_PETCI|nr:hypothetical protein Pcinc_038525 [Petrolisthes cinctipes]
MFPTHPPCSPLIPNVPHSSPFLPSRPQNHKEPRPGMPTTPPPTAAHSRGMGGLLLALSFLLALSPARASLGLMEHVLAVAGDWLVHR